VSRITWREREYSGFAGHAGGVHLFSVDWRARREQADWILRTTLPGLAHKAWESDDRAELQRRAEVILDGWLTRVNGTVTTG